MRLQGDLAELDPTLRHYYDATLLMNREVVKAIRPGVSPKELDDIAADVARQEGVAEYKSPLLGHATGLDIHDVPDFWPDPTPLRAGEIITIEPCLGVPGVAGTRIEDVVLVTDDGCDVLTKTPRGLTPE
jgi:Xaa-Pro aminopeptidase